MELKKTITSIFMVPTLKIHRDDFIENNFLNAYLEDIRRDVQYENAVYLLFKPVNFDRFREFLTKEYDRTKDILDDYDYEEGYVVLVYQLNKKWNKDFDIVKQGKYSETSQDFQNVFSKVIKVVNNGLRRDEISLQYRIFNKADELRKYWEDKLDVYFTDDMELWRTFVYEDEVLDLDKIKQQQLV
tara:strand:- start:501 stop:1058 length:558 start_codon:yes stop_codon:yes gene_type:complete